MTVIASTGGQDIATRMTIQAPPPPPLIDFNLPHIRFWTQRQVPVASHLQDGIARPRQI